MTTDEKRDYQRRWRAANRERCRENARKWRDSHPERARQLVRDHHFKTQYGLTPEGLEALRPADGSCRICRERPAEVVDHDHATGKVRGMPCRLCNSVLGFARDNPDTLRRAASYLEGTL